jgi:Ni/Fe-hydrogenase subunit HybB-like protein
MPKANRSNTRYVFLGASAMLVNGFMYRLNCYLIGYDPGQGWTYFPSAGEIMVTLGIFAFHGILYLIFVKQLPVLHAVRRA